MRHINYVLKPATIDNAKLKDKRHDLTDGGGLVLEIMPSGSKTWRFKHHSNGKRVKVTIGAYPPFTIKQARDRHEELRALVERGQSPAKAKRVPSAEQKVADARRLRWRTFAQRWVDETLFYRSGGYVAQTVRWLDVDVYPAIGDMQLDEVRARCRRTAAGAQREERYRGGLQPHGAGGGSEEGAPVSARPRRCAGFGQERDSVARSLISTGCERRSTRGGLNLPGVIFRLLAVC